MENGTHPDIVLMDELNETLKIEQIREMLARMGETIVGQTSRQSGEIRSIPLD